MNFIRRIIAKFRPAEQAAISESELKGIAQNGIKRFMRGDFDAAYPKLIIAAESGHLKAQICLAKMYFAGNGVNQCEHSYEFWLTAAANNGDKPSKAKLKKINARK